MDRTKAFRNTTLKKIGSRLKKSPVGACLVTEEKDLEYLLGFSCPGSRLLITSKGEAVYFIDSMNVSLAEKRLKGIELTDIVPGRTIAHAKAFLADRKLRKIGVRESALSVPEYRAIEGKGKKLRMVDTSHILDEAREIKSDIEIDTIRKAARKTVRVWRELKKNVSVGMSERDIAVLIDLMIRAEGFENSFTTIAATGPNTAYPHAVPTTRRFESGELLLCDFGLRFKGYCSDLTRIYSKGRINRQIRDLRDIVVKAQDSAIKMIKPGVAISTLVRHINNIFINNGKGDLILHGLGHGVGLAVHEKPFLREANDRRLKKGMVITVEPGLYKEGLGGVRVEDMVLVTAKGCEVLTK